MMDLFLKFLINLSKTKQELTMKLVFKEARKVFMKQEFYTLRFTLTRYIFMTL